MTPASSYATLAPREPARAQSERRFELRCADVVPVRCEEIFCAHCASEAIGLACEHGKLIHGFTPGWYTPERLVLMAGTVTER